MAVRDDHQAILGHDHRKVYARLGQFDPEDMVAIGFHFDHTVQIRFARRAGLGIFYPGHGVDNVFGSEGLAVMKFDSFSQLENPFRGIRIGFPGLCQLRLRHELGIY